MSALAKKVSQEVEKFESCRPEGHEASPVFDLKLQLPEETELGDVSSQEPEAADKSPLIKIQLTIDQKTISIAYGKSFKFSILTEFTL